METLYDMVKKGKNLSTFGKAINVLTKKERCLYIAYFQLTPICNLKCKMCYARLSPRDVMRSGKHILRFAQWKRYIDAAIQEGLTELSLTGGECTLHPDFCDIYSYAYDQGLQITVMTNGSFLTNQILSLWKSKPPLSISITIYGSSIDTYDRLCGNKLAFKKVYQNIKILEEAGFFLNLKYTAVRENIQDLLTVDRLCRQGGHMLYPSYILTRFNRCTSAVLEEEKADEETFRSVMRHIREERKNVIGEWNESGGKDEEDGIEDMPENSCDLEAGRRVPGKGIICSAARNSCYIDWQGIMTPCVAFDAIRLDPAQKGFHACWEELKKWADEIPVLEECVSCIYKYKCSRCIALHYNDTGVFNKVSLRLCWKRKYPKKAEKIEKQLIAKGLLPTGVADEGTG